MPEAEYLEIIVRQSPELLQALSGGRSGEPRNLAGSAVAGLSSYRNNVRSLETIRGRDVFSRKALWLV